MTSVLNHRLQLNGSSIVLCILFLFMVACSTSKSGKKTPTPPPTKEVEKVRVYDPATGTYILVPRDAVKVDTIKWTEDKTPPIITDEVVISDPPEKKTKYEISLLIPLNARSYPVLDGQIDTKLLRFMQFYGGMRIAASEIESMGLPVVIHSFDTETSLLQVNEILKDPAVKNSDVIVGPYDKDNIMSVANFGNLNEKMVISPWLPAFHSDVVNPFFIQTIPGLNTNADAIMNFIDDEFIGKKIYLVARNNPTEIQRLALFKNIPGVKTEDLIIDDASIDLAKTNLGFLLDDPDGTVFVMPYYSRADESFVNSFMRKLHADKTTQEVIVFGLPQWTGFNNLNPNYMESLAVHISSPTYINTDHPSYRKFRNKFFEEYFAMPDNQAYQGYDLLMWIATSLSAGGPDGLLGNKSSTEFGLASGYEVKPVYKTGAINTAEMNTPLYYENSKVRILKYINQDFQLAK